MGVKFLCSHVEHHLRGSGTISRGLFRDRERVGVVFRAKSEMVFVLLSVTSREILLSAYCRST
jgi:hypothetical protein